MVGLLRRRKIVDGETGWFENKRAKRLQADDENSIEGQTGKNLTRCRKRRKSDGSGGVRNDYILVKGEMGQGMEEEEEANSYQSTAA